MKGKQIKQVLNYIKRGLKKDHPNSDTVKIFVDAMEKVLYGVEDPDEKEFLLLPFRVQDWNKQKSGTLHFSFEDCIAKITDEEGALVGQVEGLMGGGLEFMIKEPGQQEINYTSHNKTAWNAFCRQTGREEFMLS